MAAIIYSDCGTYRYWYRRQWGDRAPCVFIFLTPGADTDKAASADSKAEQFAHRWGCGGAIIVSAFAYRTDNAPDLPLVPDPVGPENDTYIIKALAAQKVRNVICAWGTDGGYLDRDRALAKLITPFVPVRCFNELTKAGMPPKVTDVNYGTPIVAYFDRGNLRG